VFGALISSDAGDIHRTIRSLIEDKVRVRIVGLAAQVAVCRELCRKTNAGDECNRHFPFGLTPATYGVVLNEQHFRDLLFEATIPPATHGSRSLGSALIMMGFPSRFVENHPSLCAWYYNRCHSHPSHSQLNRGGYTCPRCASKVCSLPIECPVCGLTLILSTHLARSYHHLFPLRNWPELTYSEWFLFVILLTSRNIKSTHCYGCQVIFPPATRPELVSNAAIVETSTGTQRFVCPSCHNHFCIDCDLFCHEVLHNCPGCERVSQESNGKVNGEPNGDLWVDPESMIRDT
jgi:transcription initiation factor TFIIH subunit 2